MEIAVAGEQITQSKNSEITSTAKAQRNAQNRGSERFAEITSKDKQASIKLDITADFANCSAEKENMGWPLRFKDSSACLPY